MQNIRRAVQNLFGICGILWYNSRNGYGIKLPIPVKRAFNVRFCVV